MYKLLALKLYLVTRLFKFANFVTNPTVMSVFTTIGKNIKLFREKMQLTQEEMSSFVGISREMLSYYESGTREIPISTLEKISTWFGVDVADLLEENETNVTLKVAFAFRADKLKTQDFEAISRFRRIVENYRKMKKML